MVVFEQSAVVCLVGSHVPTKQRSYALRRQRAAEQQPISLSACSTEWFGSKLEPNPGAGSKEMGGGGVGAAGSGRGSHDVLSGGAWRLALRERVGERKRD